MPPERDFRAGAPLGARRFGGAPKRTHHRSKRRSAVIVGEQTVEDLRVVRFERRNGRCERVSDARCIRGCRGGTCRRSPLAASAGAEGSACAVAAE